MIPDLHTGQPCKVYFAICVKLNTPELPWGCLAESACGGPSARMSPHQVARGICFSLAVARDLA